MVTAKYDGYGVVNVQSPYYKDLDDLTAWKIMSLLVISLLLFFFNQWGEWPITPSLFIKPNNM